MCGIVGIVSNKSVSANIVGALKKLEYRGYDSAGIATINKGQINEQKCLGRVDNLEKILSVQGVDMVQFGSSDYSITIGKSGQNSDPEVVEAEDYMIETALRLGVAPRAVIKDWREADRYIRLGVKHFCMGFDISTIYNFCNEKGGSLAKKIGR